MEIVKSKTKMREIVEDEKRKGRVAGLVPTMGYFHKGHLELMKKACSECDVVVVSLFVNPTQFSEGEDLKAYPRDFERDCRLAEREGVDYIFAPEKDEMYPDDFLTEVKVKEISEVMCGAYRPGHFTGVATVVAKLFNIVPAQRAYFGRKDAQQLVIIRKMARDMDFPVEINAIDIVRENDGLAMSSRNSYLNPTERRESIALFHSLVEAGKLIDSGERDAGVIKAAMEEVVARSPVINLEYITICDNIYLKPLDELSGQVLIAIAAYVGKARLIDNIVVDLE
ncbi:MAG: pantoate--beta-alanine ligase [Actinobacteria bacterium]|nr:pantoate--beta-alanine ligase [Actinomycetota bacterium]